jgi:nucleoside-diphosphate-sugar epimerase
MSDALNRFRLDGRIVLVTGASSGLGTHFAHLLASAGVPVRGHPRTAPTSCRPGPGRRWPSR